MNGFFRRLLKIPLAFSGLFQTNKQSGVSFLIYHSVSNQLQLELDLPYATFQRQIKFLAQTNHVISYDQALSGLKANCGLGRDAFVLTFDDGYEDFYTAVFPLLRQYQLPAILFVNTGFVETGQPYPLLPKRPLPIKPVNWDMLAEMVNSELITLGAHTHTHPELSTTPPEQIEEELTKPIHLFKQQLGMTVKHFAYPRALWNERVEAQVCHYYESAVIGNGRKALPSQFHPYRIPRIPIRRSDGWFFFQAKVRGWLTNEESFYQTIKQIKAHRNNQ